MARELLLEARMSVLTTFAIAFGFFLIVGLLRRRPEPRPVWTRPATLPPLNFVSTRVTQDPSFPKDRWVRTVLFDGKTPFLGFTYVDDLKRHAIKGDVVTELPGDPERPSATMMPIPPGHPMTVLSDDEIRERKLPNRPSWLRFYQ